MGVLRFPYWSQVKWHKPQEGAWLVWESEKGVNLKGPEPELKTLARAKTVLFAGLFLTPEGVRSDSKTWLEDQVAKDLPRSAGSLQGASLERKVLLYET